MQIKAGINERCFLLTPIEAIGQLIFQFDVTILDSARNGRRRGRNNRRGKTERDTTPGTPTGMLSKIT